jgi:hypothetical protein
MKGVIIKCLQDLVETKFGKDKWQQIREAAGIQMGTLILVSSDMPDEQALGLLRATEKVLGISSVAAADAFGEHWMTVYAPRIYGAVYRNTTGAKDFLLKMNDLHRDMVQRFENAKPPRFDYAWEDDDTLLMTYHSDRGLMDIFAGLAKGVGLYFKEPLQVTRVGSDRLRIRFA